MKQDQGTISGIHFLCFTLFILCFLKESFVLNFLELQAICYYMVCSYNKKQRVLNILQLAAVFAEL